MTSGCLSSVNSETTDRHGICSSDGVRANFKARCCSPLELSVLSFGLCQDRHVEVRIFPQSEEGLILLSRGRLVTAHSVGTRQLQPSKGASYEVLHDTPVIQ